MMEADASRRKVMEKPSGLRECPRCGMKNRQGAYQCDFCGWDFRNSDRWDGKVADLENLSRDIAAAPLDKKLASKIEMTIKRPSDIPVRAPRPPAQEQPSPKAEEPREDAPTIAPEQEPELAEEPEPAPAEEPAPESVPLPEPEPAAAEPETPEPQPAAVTPPAVEAAPVEAPPAPLPSPPKAEGIPKPLVITVALLGTGLALYIAALILAADIGKAAGWGLTIVGALLIALSVRRVFVLRRKAETDEVVLCPNCHEVVTDHDPGCPSCGIKFSTPFSKE